MISIVAEQGRIVFTLQTVGVRQQAARTVGSRCEAVGSTSSRQLAAVGSRQHWQQAAQAVVSSQ